MQVFAQRRQRLIEKMGNGIAILQSAPVSGRNGDVEYDYRQSSDFYYLTGFDEPSAVAVISPHKEGQQFTLFVRPRNPEREIWDGPRAGIDGAKETYGADAAYDIAELDKRLPDLFLGAESLYYQAGTDSEFDSKIFGLMNRHIQQSRAVSSGPDKMVSLSALLNEFRLIKSAEEIDCLRQAADVSAKAHREAMRVAKPGLWEYQVEAVLEYTFRAHGSPRNGYPSIVATGEHSTILHYNTNRAQIQPGDLMLIDAGCEMDYYTADITRTFPVDGTFTKAQREIYEIVLDSQKAGVARCVEGSDILDVHNTCVKVLVEGLVSLGILEGTAEERIKDESFKRYYMHRTSHWLGMDVHDVGGYQQNGSPRPFAAGMVLTVEPGLYINRKDMDVPEEYRGIGIRIEDDILITEDGPVNLTEMAPKEVSEIEALCQSDSRFQEMVPALGD